MYLPYWIKAYDDLGNIYSCDMVRINIDFGHHIDLLHDYLNNTVKYKIDRYTSIKPFHYRYMNTIHINDDSFMLAYGFNTEGRISQTGVIEFNPNKLLQHDNFIDIWQKIKYWSYSMEVKRYDLAIDLPLPRHLISMPKQGNKIYRLTQSDSLTETLGRHNNNGFTKVYDKTKESKLDYNCTRIEITLDIDNKAIEEIPNIYIKDYQIAFREENELSQNDKVFLRLLEDIENPDFYLSQMTSRKRNKFKEFLNRKLFEADDTACEQIRYCVKGMERSIYETQC